MRVQIPINGISTSSSYKDGDCLVLSNLRKKNGVLKPVTPRKVALSLKKKYDYIFIHSLPSGDEPSYIGVRDGKVYHITDQGKTTEAETGLCSITGFKSITQIGNVLNILDSNGLQYVIWYQGSYVLINTNFDGAQTDANLLPLKVDLKVDNELNTGTSQFRRYFSDTIEYPSNLDSGYFLKENKDARVEIYKGLISKARAGVEEDGYLSDTFRLACTAIELYDGSYILHSNPILIGATNDKETRYTGLVIGSQTCDHKYNKAIFAYNAGVGVLSYNTAKSYAEKKTVTQNVYKESSSATVSTLPSSLGTSYLEFINGGGLNPDTYQASVFADMYKGILSFKINTLLNESYRPLIRSISVFITPGSPLFNYKETFIGSVGEDENTIENYQPSVRDNADIIKDLLGFNFYKVYEIPFDNIVTGSAIITAGSWTTIPAVDLAYKLGDNLFNQDQLPIDNSTHHKFIPNKQYIYNSRLHVMDYKTVLSHGFPVNYFKYIQGVGQFAPGTEEDIELQEVYEWAEVTIKTSDGISKVIRSTSFVNLHLNTYNFNPVISYPDSRATSIMFYRQYYDTEYQLAKKTFTLKASDVGNFAYYISPDLKPIEFNSFEAKQTKLTTPNETNREVITRNGLKASALSNPFNFPSLNTYQIGTGVIRWAATNAKQVSEGQFGQFPLYVGTTDRIYALNVGNGEVLYSTQTPSSNVAPISDIVCQTNYGVVFIGNRGLYLINSPEPDFISPQIEQIQIPINLQATTPSLNLQYPEHFSEREIDNIVYDALNNEIIIISDKDNLVFNLDTKEYYTTTETIEKVVENVYPGLKVMETVADKTTIKDFSQEETNQQEVTIVTRPFNFGNNDKKVLERIILKGNIDYTPTEHDTNTLKTMLYRSFDGREFYTLHGLILNSKNYKGIDLGLLQNKANQYLFVFKGVIGEKSEISMLDCEVRDDLKNTKLR